MSRIPWILLAVAGCGRISFDADGGAGSSDGGGGGDGSDAGPACVSGDGHDEDRDGVPDVCDPCPTLATFCPDTDGDGVGDLCDPNPSDPRETFTLIEGFQRTRTDLWMYDTSTVANDDLYINNQHLPTLLSPAEPEVVRLQASVTPLGQGQRQIAIVVSDGTMGRYFCEVFSDAGSSYFSGTYTPDNVSYTTDSVAIPGLDTTGDMEIELSTQLTTFSCRLAWNGMTYTTGPTSVPAGIASHSVGVLTNTVDAFVHNVVRIRQQ